MKLRNLFYLLLALPLFFAGCTENEEPNKPSPQQVKLELTSEASLTFDAEGGNGEISYTLENIIEGVGLTATCEANWVSDITIGDKITFVVTANEGEARDTKIVVGYSDKSFEVAIQQKAKEVLVSEYEMEDNFIEAQRISLAAYGYPNNYFYLAFLNADNTAVLSGILVGAEGDSVLQAGTYTTADESVYPETWALTFNDESELPFDGSDNTVVVEGNIDGYSIDFVFTDVKGKKYHFTFEGVIANMDPQGSLPTEDVNLNATHFDGEYYGTEYSDTYNYLVILSDKGLNANGYAQAGGTYYEVDLYSVASEIDAEGYITIPAGTYTFDPNDTTAEWTIGNEYSGYSKVNADGTEYDASAGYESGEAVVTADSITLRVVIGGVEHTVTYNGAPKIYVGEQGGGSEGDILSNLESDWNCNFSNHSFVVYPYGDYYEIGYNNYLVYVAPNDGIGDVAMFDVIAGDISTDSFFGEYTITDSYGTYTALTGKYDYDWDEIYGSWYYSSNDGEYYANLAPMVDGWLEIADNGDGTITVEFDVWDDADYNITGKYTGTYAVAQPSSLSATRSGAKKIANSLVVAEQKPARSKESFRVVKPAQKSAKSAAEKGLKLR